MAKKRRKKGKQSIMNNTGFLITISVLFFVAIVLVSYMLGEIIPGQYLVLILALVGSLLVVTKMSITLSNFRGRKVTVKSYIPLYNESTLMPKRNLVKLVDIMTTISLLGILWIIVGSKVTAISASSIVSLFTENNATIVNAVYIQFAITFLIYFTTTMIKGVGYVYLDNYLYKKDMQINDLGSVASVLRNKGKAKASRSAFELIYKVFYFIPLFRYVGLLMMYNRLFKLYELQGARASHKRKKKEFIEEV